MKWPLFENRIKNKVHGHQTEVDVDELWSTLEPKVNAINKKKKRRFLIFWWILAGLILAGGGLGYLYWQPSSENQVILAEKPEHGESQVSNELATIPTKSNANLNTNKPLNNKFTDSTTAQTSLSISPTPTLPMVLSKTSENPQVEINQITARESIESIPTLEPKVVVSSNGLDNKLSAPPKLIEPKKNKAFTFSIGIQSGAGTALKGFHAKSDTLDHSLDSIRRNTETPLEFINVGARVHLQHRSGIGLITGFQYTQLTERFLNVTSESEVDSVLGIQNFVTNLYNEIDTVYGPLPEITTTTTTVKHYNKYYFLDIPILLTYQFDKKPYTFGIEAGILANLKFGSKGRIMQDEDQILEIEDTNIFRTKLGISYYVGLSAGYYLRKDIIAYFSPSLRIIPQSITQVDYPLGQRYALLGLKAGIRYRF